VRPWRKKKWGGKKERTEELSYETYYTGNIKLHTQHLNGMCVCASELHAAVEILRDTWRCSASRLQGAKRSNPI